MLEEAAKLQKLARLGVKLQQEATSKSADADAGSIFQGLIADIKELSLEFKGETPRIVRIKRLERASTVYKITFSNGKQFATDIKHLFNQKTFQKLVLENLGFVPIEVRDWTGFLAKFINADR